jgi:hypothetical protein
MELAPVHDLSAVNQRHFRHFQFLVQRDSRLQISIPALSSLGVNWLAPNFAIEMNPYP